MSLQQIPDVTLKVLDPAGHTTVDLFPSNTIAEEETDPTACGSYEYTLVDTAFLLNVRNQFLFDGDSIELWSDDVSD